MHRLLYYILFVSIFFVNIRAVKAQCNDDLLNNCLTVTQENGANYIKDFRVRLKKAKKNEMPPFARYSVVLKRGIRYRFTVCDDVNNGDKAIIQLYDSTKLFGTNINKTTGKVYKSFEFVSKKTQVYYVIISINNGKEGCCVGILSSVTN